MRTSLQVRGPSRRHPSVTDGRNAGPARRGGRLGPGRDSGSRKEHTHEGRTDLRRRTVAGSRNGRDVSAHQPGQRGGTHCGGQGRRTRHRSGGECRAQGVRRGPVAAHEPARARSHRVAARRPHPAAPGRDGEARESLHGQDHVRLGQGRDSVRRRGFPVLRGVGEQDPRRDAAAGTTRSPSRCASPWAWSVQSCRGTFPSCSPRGRSRRR